ncbi:MAG: hypothetical protein K9W44_15740 [Candidatus Lokiarchaeota archaeon]|nr:hypothetical protein [Candidatus Harpocratesius repetitus]
MKNDFEKLKQRIEELQSNIEDFLFFICQINVITRESIILREYRKNIELNSPWVTEIEFVSDFIMENEFDLNHQKDSHLLHKKFLERIKKKPEEKAELIQEFLLSFPEISPADGNVLLNFLKDLPIEELSDEFKKICDLFNKK